jgi:hypothetical protein
MAIIQSFGAGLDAPSPAPEAFGRPPGIAARQKRFEARARIARLRQCRRIDYQRGLDRVLSFKPCGCDWIRQHRNLLVTGPTSLAWLQCAAQYLARRRRAVQRAEGAALDLPTFAGADEIPAIGRNTMHVKATR